MTTEQKKELLPQEAKVTIVKGVKDKEDLEDEDSIVLEVPPPPDGGWGWVVLFGSFMTAFFIDGISNSFGVFLDTFKADLNAKEGTISWAGSLICGVNMFLGPVVSGLTNRFGCRPVMIVGTLIGAGAYALSSLSESVGALIATYALAGAGFGIVYLPSIISVSYYFEEKRAITSCIASIGSAAGTFAFPTIAGKLMANKTATVSNSTMADGVDIDGDDSTSWTWQEVNLLLAGGLLTCVIYGAIMKPLKAVPVTKEFNDDMMTQLAERRGTCISFETGKFTAPSRGLSTRRGTRPSVRFSVRNSPEDATGQTQVSRTVSGGAPDHMATIEEVATPPAEHINADPFKAAPEVETIQEEESSEPEDDRAKTVEEGAVSDTEDKDIIFKPKVLEPQKQEDNKDKIAEAKKPFIHRKAMQRFASIPTKHRDIHSFKTKRRRTTPTKMPSTEETEEEEEPVHLGGISILAVDRRMSAFNLKPNETALCVRLVDTPRIQKSIKNRNIVSPLSRKDTFYNSSVRRLKKQHIARSDLPYRQSVLNYNPIANVEVIKDTQETEVKKWACPRFIFHESCWNVITSMVDVSLLKNPIFLLIILSNIFATMGFYVPFTYLVSAAKEKGIEDNDANMLVSINGIANILGRALVGVLANVKSINSFHMFNFSMISSAMVMMGFVFGSGDLSFQISSAFMGFCAAPFFSLTAVVLVSLFGLDNLTSTFGLLAMARGIAAIIGAPLAGQILAAFNPSKTATDKDYSSVFYFCGIILLLGFLLSFAVFLLQTFRPDLIGMEEYDEEEFEEEEEEEETAEEI